MKKTIRMRTALWVVNVVTLVAVCPLLLTARAAQAQAADDAISTVLPAELAPLNSLNGVSSKDCDNRPNPRLGAFVFVR